MPPFLPILFVALATISPFFVPGTVPPCMPGTPSLSVWWLRSSFGFGLQCFTVVTLFCSTLSFLQRRQLRLRQALLRASCLVFAALARSPGVGCSGAGSAVGILFQLVVFLLAVIVLSMPVRVGSAWTF